ncbi:hypothetical protein GGR56DRAFT_675361 [Xylariaceae sp. FL0804]|nr:hypothetical protein GGR56DRAFT_675361 [Xylariaceae sp. FL0804]
MALILILLSMAIAATAMPMPVPMSAAKGALPVELSSLSQHLHRIRGARDVSAEADDQLAFVFLVLAFVLGGALVTNLVIFALVYVGNALLQRYHYHVEGSSGPASGSGHSHRHFRFLEVIVSDRSPLGRFWRYAASSSFASLDLRLHEYVLSLQVLSAAAAGYEPTTTEDSSEATAGRGAWRIGSRDNVEMSHGVTGPISRASTPKPDLVGPGPGEEGIAIHIPADLDEKIPKAET